MSASARLVYCHYCHIGYPLIGRVPDVCPGCERAAKWSTTLPEGAPTECTVRWDLSDRDRLTMIWFGIVPD